MFQAKSSTNSVPASILTDNALYAIGTVVFMDTLCCGLQQKGIVARYVKNPFVGQSGMSAYIVGIENGWTDYIPAAKVGDYVACDCTDCGGQFPQSLMCPECGHCLGCCDCPTDQGDFDYPDTGEDMAFDDWHDRQALLNFRIGH